MSSHVPRATVTYAPTDRGHCAHCDGKATRTVLVNGLTAQVKVCDEVMCAAHELARFPLADAKPYRGRK
jgi:hypothetical protein